MKELKLYSPLQVDIIDRDNPGHAIPLQAVSHGQKPKYLGQIVSTPVIKCKKMAGKKCNKVAEGEEKR